MFFGGFGGYGGAPQAFDEQFHCFPAAFVDKPEVEAGDKILLPASALDTLTRLDIQYPMTFEVIAPHGKTHCSVLEFTAPEGTCYLPYWMMANLSLSEGTRVRIRNCSLPKATYVKFKPQSVDFLEITNPRAVLEHVLRGFSCVTKGDHLAFDYNGVKYYLEVTDVKPLDAACIIEADVNVDFDAPVGYKEPERPKPAPPPKPVLPEVQRAKEAAAVVEAPKFVPFSGAPYRADGKAFKPEQAARFVAAPEAGSSSSSAVATTAGGGGGGHNWGEGVGTIKVGNLAAERRAAAAKAAEARASSSSASSLSSLSAAHSAPPAIPNTGGIGGATKWSKSAKLGHFQAGSGNKMS